MANKVRLIDYDAAIDRYYAEYEKQDICCGSQDRDWLKKCFDEAPTIDPESLRPKGRWNIILALCKSAVFARDTRQDIDMNSVPVAVLI